MLIYDMFWCFNILLSGFILYFLVEYVGKTGCYKAHNKSIALSSSSSFTSIFSKSSSILLNSVNCSVTVFDSTILNEYSCCLRNCLWAKDLVIYNDSNFDHIDAVVGSFATSLKTVPEAQDMALLTFSTISAFSACDMVTGNAHSPFKAFSHFLVLTLLASSPSITQNHYFR